MLKGNTRLGAHRSAAVAGPRDPAHADEWQPISPEELQMKREPKAPTAAAIYLYRQVDRNDADSQRVHLLAHQDPDRRRSQVRERRDPLHQGLEHAFAGCRRASSIRTAASSEFDGTVYEKPLIKARGVKMMSKSFTLPNVEVGSIIEYRYRKSMPMGWAFNSRWLLSDELFTRRGCVFAAARPTVCSCGGAGRSACRPTRRPPAKERGLIRLETRDVPAFVSRGIHAARGRDEVSRRVRLRRRRKRSEEEVAYWKAFGKRSNNQVSASQNPLRSKQEVARLVQPGDSNEPKRASSTRARSRFATCRSSARRPSRRPSARSSRTMRRRRRAETRLRAARTKSPGSSTVCCAPRNSMPRCVLVSTRDENFFDPRLMNARDLNTCVVLVNLGEAGYPRSRHAVHAVRVSPVE